MVAGVFRKLSDILPSELKRRVYFSIFHSLLSYASCIWGNSCTLNLMNTIFRTQDRAIKNLFGFDRLRHSSEIYEETKIHCIKQQVKIDLVIMIHQIRNGMIHTNTYYQRNFQVHDHNTRNLQSIRRDRINTTRYGLNSVAFQGISLYNDIINIIDLNNNDFKKRIKEHYSYF